MNFDSLQIKQIENDDETISTITFLQNVLPHIINKEIWNWEFNTFPSQTVLTIIKNNNETAGTLLVMPVELLVLNQTVLSGKCENGYFHEMLKGKGLFQKLFFYTRQISIEKDMKFLWGFTPAKKVFGDKLGFSILDDAMYNFSVITGKPQLEFIKSYVANPFIVFLKYNFQYLKYLRFKLKFSIFSFSNKLKNKILKYEIKDSVTTYNDIDNLYNELKIKYNEFSHIKITQPYFDWRITSNLNLIYKTKFFYYESKLIGYYIVAINKTSCNITDFTGLDSDILNCMFYHLIKEIAGLKIVNINYFGNIDNQLNKQNFALFQQFSGYTKINKDMQFISMNINYLTSSPSFFVESKNWYLNGLWTEGFSY